MRSGSWLAPLAVSVFLVACGGTTTGGAATTAPVSGGAATAAPVATGGAATAAPVPTGNANEGDATTSVATSSTTSKNRSPVPCPVPAESTTETDDCAALYQTLLAEFGSDLSECQVAAAAGAACPKPASLPGKFKEQLNIQLVLDSSGSMASPLGGQRKMDIAKQAMTRFVDTLPATANISLRVYGHTGSNDEADRAESCKGTELFYPFQPLDAQQFKDAIVGFDATGWTPIAASLQAAQQDFAAYDGATNTNIIYLISDGIETCDGDPVAAARALHESNVQAIVNIIGFDVDAAGTAQLKQAATAGGGTYIGASNAAELDRIFRENYNWAEWTAYFNCVQNTATADANRSSAATYQQSNCVANNVTAESNRMQSEVNANSTVYGSCRGTIIQRLADRRTALISANANDLDSAIAQAQRERTAAIEAARKEGPTPTP